MYRLRTGAFFPALLLAILSDMRFIMFLIDHKPPYQNNEPSRLE
jgi:hypothetical protein